MSLTLCVRESQVPLYEGSPDHLCISFQDGTPAEEKIFGAAIAADGSLFLAGYTEGNWSSQATGNSDFVIAKLHPDNGAVLWRWQVT